MDKYLIEFWPYVWVTDSVKEDKKVSDRRRYDGSGKVTVTQEKKS